MSRIPQSFASPFALAALLLCCSGVSAQDSLPNHKIAVEPSPANGVVRITLPEAQSRARETPAVRAANLIADAAKYRRQAAAADYFPKVGATFANLHFNKLMGDTIPVANRSIEVPLLNKDQSILAFTVTQPVTPLLKVREEVRLAKADEIIADAKASKAVADVASNVEAPYFALLIAQLQQDEAASRMESLRPHFQVASTSGPQSVASAFERDDALQEASSEFTAARSKVLELTQALNAMLGFPPDTELQLTVPEPLVIEPMTLTAARQKAQAGSVEVIEAEQGLAKAQAAAKLGKLEYVPDVAVLGGYSYQTAMNLLPGDFTFLGVVATFNVFDFGKREKTIKERNANLELAQMNLQAVRAKIATAVQRAYLDLERASRIRDLTRELFLVRQSTASLALSSRTTGFKAEIEMAQAELDYRMAYFQLQQAIGIRER
jgi:outer membrane protein TolC